MVDVEVLLQDLVEVGVVAVAAGVVLPVLAPLEQGYLLRLSALLHRQLLIVLVFFIDLLFELLEALLDNPLGPHSSLMLKVLIHLKPRVQLLAAQYELVYPELLLLLRLANEEPGLYITLDLFVKLVVTRPCNVVALDQVPALEEHFEGDVWSLCQFLEFLLVVVQNFRHA